jgi:hypothetical protein
MWRRNLAGAFDVLDRLLQTCLRAWEGFWGLLPLWLRAWFSVQARVCKDLGDRAKEVDELIDKRYCWRDHEVLVWDHEVRSILERHLTPHHLSRYHDETRLDARHQKDRDRSRKTLETAKYEIEASIEAVKRKTVVPAGGLSDAWWFRTGAAGFILAGIALLMNQIVIPSLPAGNGPSVTTASDPSFGTVQKIVEDPGKVVEVTPMPEPTPSPTPIPTGTPTPTPTAVLPVSEEPVIDIPPEPEEDQPTDEAEERFKAGVDALEAENFKLAVKEFEAAIEAEPGFVRAYYNLAVAYANMDTEEDNQAAVDNYTAAIELWNSLDSDGDGLLFEAKLARGLLLVTFSTEKQAICLGRSDLLEYLERGDPSQRNTEAVNKALAGIEVACEEVEEIP